MRFGAKPQSVDRGRRSQLAQTNHSQPACKLQVRADSRDCPYRQALAERKPSWAGTASTEALYSDFQAPGGSAQLS